jgi:hypothetical protein
VAAFTLVAYSVEDGGIVWQANEARAIERIMFNSQQDAARECLENIFKRLQDRWKKSREQGGGK